MDLKMAAAFAAIIASFIGYLPYIRDILGRKTKPHIYSWLIWLITTGTAVAGVIYGEGGLTTLYLGSMFLMVLSVVLLSTKYGTKNIARADTIMLTLATISILVWWQLKQPLLSILMATAIDVLGYAPSFRKSFADPWSETLSSWIFFALSNVLGILALNSYNLMTTTYLVAILISNLSLVIMCATRRKYIETSE